MYSNLTNIIIMQEACYLDSSFRAAFDSISTHIHNEHM